MSATDVREQLERFEQLSRDNGAISIERMRSGITPKRIRALENQYQLQLPEDAKAVWSWHDGVAEDVMLRFRFWGSGYYFLDLESSIKDAKMRLDIRNAGDIHRYPGSTWVTLGHSTICAVIEVTEPNILDAIVLVSDATTAPDEYPVVTVAKRIWWWNWAIENGVWYVGEDRQWFTNVENLPRGPERNLL